MNLKFFTILFLATVAFAGMSFSLRERKNIVNIFGDELANIIYGYCDKDIENILARRDRLSIPRNQISEIFINGPSDMTIYPISLREEKYLLHILRHKFGGPRYFRYVIAGRSDGIVIHPVSEKNERLFDAIQFDGCGNLVGDDYYTRIRHQDSLTTR